MWLRASKASSRAREREIREYDANRPCPLHSRRWVVCVHRITSPDKGVRAAGGEESPVERALCGCVGGAVGGAVLAGGEGEQ
eukprot:scaffold201600_cov30-Tisochrysis_lutea.AAC.1